MKVTRLKALGVAVAAVAAGAAVSLALPAGAAVSLQSQSPPIGTVKLANTARLDAKGAVVFTGLRITCPPGTSAFYTVTVTEAVGRDIASGSTSDEVDACTGRAQNFTVAVTPTQHPFRRGVAFGQARLTVCSFGCKTFRDEHNVQIR
jgi:hypothetical protein